MNRERTKILCFMMLFLFKFIMGSNFATEEKRMNNDIAKKILYEYWYTLQELNEISDKFAEKRRINNDSGTFIDTKISISEKYTDEEEYKGDILAIDIGGSQLKLILYQEGLKKRSETRKFLIPRTPETKNVDFFSWIVEKIKIFFSEINYEISEEKEPIGAAVTFSYQIHQTSLSSGTIGDLTKDFPFMVVPKGADPVKLLNEKLKNEKMNIEVRIIENDTTATLIASYEKDNRTNIAIVLGTGTNAAYIDGCKIINSEWGKFDKVRLNKYDMEIKNDVLMNGKVYAPVDCVAGGLKLNEVLKKIAPWAKYEKMMQEYSDDTMKDIDLYTAIKSIKMRSFGILAAMTYSLDNNPKEKSVYIGVNGSGLQEEKDKSCFIKELKKIYKMKNGFEKDVYLVSVEDASLRGAAYSLIHNGKIPKGSLNEKSNPNPEMNGV